MGSGGSSGGNEWNIAAPGRAEVVAPLATEQLVALAVRGGWADTEGVRRAYGATRERRIVTAPAIRTCLLQTAPTFTLIAATTASIEATLAAIISGGNAN